MNERSQLVLTIIAAVATACFVSPSCFAESSWRFAVVGDSQGNSHELSACISPVWEEIVGALLGEDIDFLLFMGDMTEGHPTSKQEQIDQLMLWRNLTQPLYDAGISVYSCRGNHEVHEDYAEEVWDMVFGGRYAMPQNGPYGEKNVTFAVRHKNVLAVGFDLWVSWRWRKPDQAWVDEQLASNSLPHIFTFAHDPAFKLDHTSTFAYKVAERDAFWKSIRRAGSRMYFCGHDHFYNHTRIEDGCPGDDVHQFVVATGGQYWASWEGLYDGDNSYWLPELVYHKERTSGYMVVEVDGLAIRATWKQRTDPNTYEAADSFSYSVSRPLKNVRVFNYPIDTMISEGDPTGDHSGSFMLNVTSSNAQFGGFPSEVLIRFDDIFGDEPGRIPTDANILSATLELNTLASGSGASLHRMLTAWSETDNYSSFGGDGIQPSIEAEFNAESIIYSSSVAVTAIDVYADVVAWQANPPSNQGWVLIPVGEGGFYFQSSEANVHPTLIVEYGRHSGSSDLAVNGHVDFADYAAFASRWLDTGCGSCGNADYNGDGELGPADLQAFAEDWLAGLKPNDCEPPVVE